MAKSHAPISAALTTALVAIAFCVWTALGNDINICVTTGCTLYEDFSIGGISMWWYGTCAFTILAVFALLGQAKIGSMAAGLMLIGDIYLLALMALTAPCVNCLIVALLFALCYLLFRRKVLETPRQSAPSIRRPSILLWVWLALFIVNLGQIAKSQIDIWPILDESGEPITRLFFSPSCPYCIEGVNALSGNINTAFYPVAENDMDVARVENMFKLIEQGENIADALAQSENISFQSLWAAWRPDIMLLRFRLLCNKAHLFSQGSQGVPFFEHKGLMPGLIKKDRKEDSPDLPASTRAAPSIPGGDDTLPLELQENLQCGENTPCPPG